MRNLKVIDAELEQLKAKRTNEFKILRDEQLTAIRRSLVQCVQCSKKSKLSQWTFIQNLWYSPAIRNEDGGWQYHKTETCYITCPRCDGENYINNHPQKEKVIRLITSYSFRKDEIFQKVVERKDKKLY